MLCSTEQFLCFSPGLAADNRRDAAAHLLQHEHNCSNVVSVARHWNTIR